jgi:hypothetical protein
MYDVVSERGDNDNYRFVIVSFANISGPGVYGKHNEVIVVRVGQRRKGWGS